MDNHEMKAEGAWPAGWAWALVAAIVAAILARWLGDVSIGAALFFGLMVFIVFWVLFAQFWHPVVGDGHGNDDGHDGGRSGGHDDGHDHGHSDGHSDGHSHGVTASVPMMAAPATAKAPVTPAPVTPAPVTLAPAMAPPAPAIAVQATPVAVARVAAARTETPTPVSAAPLPVEPPMAAAAVPAPTIGVPMAAAETAMRAAKPQGLPGPRNGTADALQEVEGIGPVLEKLCHDIGIFHFDQIASWGAAEIAWMDANLKGFKGRVSRDKWVAQARLIGAEGIDGFRIRAKTNDY